MAGKIIALYIINIDGIGKFGFADGLNNIYETSDYSDIIVNSVM